MIYDHEFLQGLEEGLRGILPAWGVAASAPLSRLAVSENATFLAIDGARRIVLRVYRPDYHGEAEILSELAWIDALRRDRVVATPRPVPMRDGSLLAGFRHGAARRVAAAFEHMSGREPAAGEGDGGLARWFGHLGAIAARLHAHAKAWTRPEGFVRKTWTFDTILGPKAYWGDWREAPGLDGAGRRTLERAARALEDGTAAFGRGPERFGLVHCDMRAANLLVDGDRLGVIDFDDCGLSWFAYDFAAAVSFIEHEPVVPALMAAWIDGYRSVAAFPDDQARALPMFVLLRRMQLTAWIASHSETPTARAMGPAYTAGTVALADAFLSPPRSAGASGRPTPARKDFASVRSACESP